MQTLGEVIKELQKDLETFGDHPVVFEDTFDCDWYLNFEVWTNELSKREKAKAGLSQNETYLILRVNEK